MKKFAFACLALFAIAFTAPTTASAETVIIKKGGHHHDRGWHRGWDHGHGHKTVIIKKGRHHD